GGDPAIEAQLRTEPAVQRKHPPDRANQPSAFLDTDRLDRFDRPAPPDREPMGPDDRHVAGKPGEAAESQLPLDVAATGQDPCECSDLIRLSLVGRDHRPKLGPEARIDAPLLGALRDRAEAPEGRRQRSDREEKEIDREFVLEACKHRPTVSLALRLLSADSATCMSASSAGPAADAACCGIRGCRVAEDAGGLSACCCGPSRGGSRSFSPLSRSACLPR